MGKDREEKSESTDLKRIADALERLATAQEQSVAKLKPLGSVAHQLKNVSESLEGFYKLGFQTAWYTQYRRLDDAVNPAALESMKTMLEEFMTHEYSAQILRGGGADTLDHRLKRLLMKQRVYEYLLFTSDLATINTGFFPDAGDAVERWLKELAYDHDFRMVHVRQGSYYPEFSEKVREAFLASAQAAEERGEHVASEMIRRVVEISKADAAFEQYAKLDSDNPLRQRYERIAAANFLKVPMGRRTFQHFWLHYPEWNAELQKAELEKEKAEEQIPPN